MRVLVCGGRDCADAEFVYRTLNQLHKRYAFDVVIEGDARGVDRIAGFWARRKRLENRKFRADWHVNGRAAGPIRNALMLTEGRPDMVVAFPGGRGTANMVELAKRAGVPVYEVVP